jgi:hypothetical protein
MGDSSEVEQQLPPRKVHSSVEEVPKKENFDSINAFNAISEGTRLTLNTNKWSGQSVYIMLGQDYRADRVKLCFVRNSIHYNVAGYVKKRVHPSSSGRHVVFVKVHKKHATVLEKKFIPAHEKWNSVDYVVVSSSMKRQSSPRPEDKRREKTKKARSVDNSPIEEIRIPADNPAKDIAEEITADPIAQQAIAKLVEIMTPVVKNELRNDPKIREEIARDILRQQAAEALTRIRNADESDIAGAVKNIMKQTKE